jgi:hypothetical protein
MKYITQAVSGEFKGKYRDSWEDELITPEPVSPDYPANIPTPDTDSPDFFEWQKQQEAKKLGDDDSPDFFEWQKQQEAKKLAEEKEDTPEVESEKELGNADDEKEEEAENILKTVSSMNDKKINEGLDLLVPKEEEDKDKKDEDEDDSSKTKKIT